MQRQPGAHLQFQLHNLRSRDGNGGVWRDGRIGVEQNQGCSVCDTMDHFIRRCPVLTGEIDNGGTPIRRVRLVSGIARPRLKPITADFVRQMGKRFNSDVYVQHASRGSGQLFCLIHSENSTYSSAAKNKQYVIRNYSLKELADARLPSRMSSIKDGFSAMAQNVLTALSCPLCSNIFLEPRTTSCCGATYCHHCVTSALCANLGACPSCQQVAGNIGLELIQNHSLNTTLTVINGGAGLIKLHEPNILEKAPAGGFSAIKIEGNIDFDSFNESAAKPPDEQKVRWHRFVKLEAVKRENGNKELAEAEGAAPVKKRIKRWR